MNIITFSGVDGAGKTTILRECTEILQNNYEFKVKELRHRPCVFPILSTLKYGKKASEKTMEALPRTGNNKSKISSYIRFFYYLLDYLIGQWIIYFNYNKKNSLIIYDRYYFDFINDPKRANIELNKSFVKFFYRFIFKPKINIFLHAPSEIILSRKKELDAETIDMLTDNYKKLFEEYSNKYKQNYICIENIDKEKTLSILDDIFKKEFK